MVKHYTELAGATGERIQFGAPIYPAALQFKNAPPIVRIGLQTFALESVSALGCGLRVEQSHAELDVGSDAAELCFEQGSSELLRIRAIIPTRAEDGVLQCRFFDRALDVDVLTSANARTVALDRGLVSMPAPEEVPTAYKVFCADTLDFLANIRRQIDAELTPFAGALDADEVRVLDQEMELSIAKRWATLIREANRLVLPYKNDPKTLSKIKRYTENILTPVLCQGALWNRSYTKPMGYPGDFEIMNAFYDQSIIGNDPYTRLLGILGLRSGAPVTARMNRLVDEIKALKAANPTQEHFHMMSIGAGPARELQDFFASGEADGSSYSFTLVDPEPKALEHAIRHIYSAVKTDVSSVIVSGMNTSFTEMLRPTKTFRHLPPQDFIYSAGLTDYLNSKLTKSLITKLYDYLKPGGSVLIGNINDAEDGMFWTTECVLDWTMYFRSQKEMEDIADDLPGIAELSVDTTGSFYMLKITKPA